MRHAHARRPSRREIVRRSTARSSHFASLRPLRGVAPSVVKDGLNANAARREQLESQLAATEEVPPLLHPEMARTDREKVSELAKALQKPDSRSEATEALRGLVDAIVLAPDEGGETLQIELRGTWWPCWGRPYKRRGRRNPTTSPCKHLWLRGLATR